MLAHYFSFSLSISFISWMVGIIFHSMLTKTEYYVKLSNLNIIKSRSVNKMIGMGIFKWIVRNTFFKFFNPKLKLKYKVDISDLEALRMEMTSAEISHLIGFLFVVIFIVNKLVHFEFLFALILTIINILMNLYPSLLQQENKRRIDKTIKFFRKEKHLT